MKFALSIFVLCAFCAINVLSFSVFKKKFVNGCDPNPCDHKASCTLNPKNNTLFTCQCTEGYHGITCDKKTGCYSKPCSKHGVCSNNKTDLSLYSCECEHGYVGATCDTEDKCIKKNPCTDGQLIKTMIKTIIQ